jgi:hypothetical protein
MARVARRAAGAAKKGVKKTVTPARAAQIHRWQMLGAAARKGQKKAQRSRHQAVAAKNRKEVVSTYASAAKWGVQKLIMPTSLVTPYAPGYQPGDRTRAKPRKKRR